MLSINPCPSPTGEGKEEEKGERFEMMKDLLVPSMGHESASEFESQLWQEETQAQWREYNVFLLRVSRSLEIKPGSFHHAGCLVVEHSIILCLFRVLFRAKCPDTTISAVRVVC